MVDTPANQAPVETGALAHVYGRAGASIGQGFVKYPANQFAHAVGFAASDKGKIPYIDASGDYTNLSPGSATAVPYINSSGIPAWSGTGVDGQFLTLSSGVPTWSGNPNAFFLIQTQTASGSASVAFTSGFSSIYDEYMFELIGVYPSTTANLLMTVSINGGSSYLSSAYAYNMAYSSNPSTVTGSGSNSASAWTLLGAGMVNSTDAAFGKISVLTSTTRVGFVSSLSHASSGTFASSHAGGSIATASLTNAIRFQAASGNLTGTIRMYGVKNS